MAIVSYVSPEKPSLSTNVLDRRLQFEGGVLQLDSKKDAKYIEVLDEHLKEIPALAVMIKKVDKAAAEAAAKKVQEEMKQTVVSGSVVTGLREKALQEKQKLIDSGELTSDESLQLTTEA